MFSTRKRAFYILHGLIKIREGLFVSIKTYYMSDGRGILLIF